MNLHSEEVLFSLMSRYYDELFRYGVKFTGNVEETKDNVNQFFIHFWNNREKLEKVENLKAYIFVSFKRWLITRMQQQQNHTVIALDYHTSELAEPSYEEYLVAQIKDHELAKVLRQAIESLPRRQKELLQLRFYEHLSYEEIAQKTSLSVRTVYNKLHEAVKSLRNNTLIAQLRNNLFL